MRGKRNINRGEPINEYTAFLNNMVDNADEYSVLLDILHGMRFYSLVPNDDNRGKDGEHLREIFTDSVGGNPSFYRDLGECTVLEMLLALSDRLVFETIDSEWEKTQSEWFFILLDNLSIERYDNSYIRPGKDEFRIQDRVERMLSRNYDSHGVGGLFPLKNAKFDQRKVEIWYQMSAYIMENYF
jgi:hypothetical protein